MPDKIDQYILQIKQLAPVQQELLALKLQHSLLNNRSNEQLVAFVTEKEKGTILEKDLRKYISQTLPEHMQPAQIKIIKDMPRTHNGKIDRETLSSLKTKRIIKNEIKPDNDVEKVLKGIWESVLNLSHINTTDNFFNIGGHSLLVTALVAQIRDIFPVKLSLNSVFDNPTIIELANYMLSDSEKEAEIKRTAEIYLQLAELSEEELDSRFDEIE